MMGESKDVSFETVTIKAIGHDDNEVTVDVLWSVWNFDGVVVRLVAHTVDEFEPGEVELSIESARKLAAALAAAADFAERV